MEEESLLRFSLRLPRDLHERITVLADKNSNSLNAEMLRLLELATAKETPKEPDKTLVEQLLPPSILWRVSRFKNNRGLKSNEEAVKRLVGIALDDTESAKDILDKLAESYKTEKDIRVLARDGIATHSAVDQIMYGPRNEYVWFSTKQGESGAITNQGKLQYSDSGAPWDQGMDYYKPPQPKAAPWDVKPTQDMDNEIPF